MYKDHVFYRDFLKEYPIIERGEGVYLYDSEGNCYLDACSGSMNVTIGHGVAEVAEAMAEQGRKVAMVWGSFGRT
ncbi:MAG: aminotransferase class III-fold pyridoxal phosphate-dependent enzyme, partial [Chloroflexi bacterium]|nr:aminotransferase class III-fold pyridoxal phosphate-dependent enzyme [Chloroflexota bacterium]